MIFGKILVVAELSANHNQNIETALKTVEAAKNAGADAVKIQTYTADTLTIDCDNSYFRINSGTVWDGETLYSLYKRAYTPWEWHAQIKDYVEELGMVFFSTPFDFSAVDFLEELGVDLYKIASFEITDIPLIKYAASKAKPMIISTGIASLDEISDAVDVCRSVNNNDIILLKCTSAYPAPIEEANLLTMNDMAKKFAVDVGLSDHTVGSSAAIAAAALGAKVIEKHFILDRSIGGPDSSFSMEPDEFRAMVNQIRDTEKALGCVSYEITPQIQKSRVFSRSLFVVNDIKKGELFNEQNIRSIRPGYGISPKYYDVVIGKTALLDLKRGTPLSFDMVDCLW